jgi:hypothetical protein
MEEIRARLAQIEATLDRLQESQQKIEDALLGSLDRVHKGLITDISEIRTDIVTINKELDSNKPAIIFFKNAKVIIAVISLTIPVLFEIAKFALTQVFKGQ